MCELFAMSADRPTDVGRSLSLLMPRGGKIGPHADGWGVAYYEGRAARIFKEPAPAWESRCLALLAEYDLKSTTVVAHIRKANPAVFGRATANTPSIRAGMERLLLGLCSQRQAARTANHDRLSR